MKNNLIDKSKKLFAEIDSAIKSLDSIKKQDILSSEKYSKIKKKIINTQIKLDIAEFIHFKTNN